MRKRGNQPTIDVIAILEERVKVKRGEVVKSMDPFDAELEHLVGQALGGSIKAAERFIRYCIRHGILAKPEPFDDEYVDTVIPNDWEDDEYIAMFNRHGPPPWPGSKDGLTAEARELRQQRQRRRRR